ncbi:MAG TPA: hypothetical protein VFR15_11075 [Chloroflexia bacterium]|nr:hypothetical protein [Chloroflexia bacterium]
MRDELSALVRLLGWWPAWLLPVALAIAVVLLTQRPVAVEVDVGSPRDEAFVRNFHTRLEQPGATYRWSDVYGYIALPGVGGSRQFTVELTLDVPRPATVTVIVNGETLFDEEVSPGWRTVEVAVDETHPVALASRDLVVEVRAPQYRDETAPGESRGVRVDRLAFRQAGDGGFIWPALAPVVWLCGAVLALYLLVGRTLWGIAAPRRSHAWAFATAIAGAAALAVLYVVSRVDLAAASGQLFATALTGLGLLVLGDRLLRRWAPEGSAGTTAARIGAAAVALAFILRFGGMGLPQAVIIDMPWHMKWLTTLLAGNWQALYYPGGLSSVPAEWGLELLIPKSPLFYVAAAPAALLPFDLETSVKWLICLLDSSVTALAFWFGWRLRAGYRTAVGAAVLYALMPLAFRAFAYGILPTIFTQWLAALLFAFVLAQSDRPPRPAAVIGTVLLAALAIVAFPTVAVFVTLVLLGYAVVLAIRTTAMARFRAAWQVGAAVAGGWLIAVVVYYGLYVEPVFASARALLGAESGGGSVRWPGGPAELVTWTADYVVTMLPLLLAVTGLAAYFVVRRTRRPGLALVLLTLWLAILPLFMAANYRMDMIGKHLFFTTLPVAVLGGAALALLWARGRWSGVLTALLVGVVGWQGLVFWVERLVRAST